jgi:hypothetical protein
MRAYGKTLTAYREEPLSTGGRFTRPQPLHIRAHKKRARVTAQKEIDLASNEDSSFLREIEAETEDEIEFDRELYEDYLSSRDPFWDYCDQDLD